MPWEVTEQYIRSGHREPGETCRTIDIDADRGIKAIYCRYGDAWSIQSYLFAREKGWTLESAKQWFAEHERAGAISYAASLSELREQDGKRLAKIRVIDPDINKQNWGVTPDSIQRALESLRYARIAGPPAPGHKPNVILPEGFETHIGAWERIGTPIDAGIDSDGSAYLWLSVDSDWHWDQLKAGNLKAVSPGIFAFARYFDDEGRERVTDFVFDHVLFVPPDRTPAYEDLGVTALCENDVCNFTKALAAFLNGHHEADDKMWETTRESRQGSREKTRKISAIEGGVRMANAPLTTFSVEFHGGADAWDTADAPDEFFAYVPEEARGENGKKSLRKLPLASIQKRDLDPAIIRNALARFKQADIPESEKADVLRKICAAAKKLGIESELCGTAKEAIAVSEKDPCEHAVEELKAKIATLEAQLAEKNKELEAKTALEERLAKLESERHMEAVNRVATLRVRAGLAKDLGAEVERLKGFSAETLTALEADAREVERLREQLSEPIAKFGATSEQDLRNAIEATRMAMFGYKRNEKFEKVI